MLRELISDLVFGMQLQLTFILFLLKVLWSLCSRGKCLENTLRKYLPILLVALLLKGGLNRIMPLDYNYHNRHYYY